MESPIETRSLMPFSMKALWSAASGLMFIEPHFLWGVLFLFAFNSVASLWLTLSVPGREVSKLLTDTIKRLCVYVLTLWATIVLSHMVPYLEVLRVTMFGAIGAWEFLTMLGMLARIEPRLKPLYKRAVKWVADKTPLIEEGDDVHIKDNVDTAGR